MSDPAYDNSLNDRSSRSGRKITIKLKSSSTRGMKSSKASAKGKTGGDGFNEKRESLDSRLKKAGVELDDDVHVESLLPTSTEPLHQSKRLNWNHKVNLIGNKVVDPMIHFCEKCHQPILTYGRMIPCKHVFCLGCAKKMDKTCPRCDEAVVRIEHSALGTVYVCTFGGTKHGFTGCHRTYLSQRDLKAHIEHRHYPSLQSASGTPSQEQLVPEYKSKQQIAEYKTRQSSQMPTTPLYQEVYHSRDETHGQPSSGGHTPHHLSPGGQPQQQPRQHPQQGPPVVPQHLPTSGPPTQLPHNLHSVPPPMLQGPPPPITSQDGFLQQQGMGRPNLITVQIQEEQYRREQYHQQHGLPPPMQVFPPPGSGPPPQGPPPSFAPNTGPPLRISTPTSYCNPPPIIPTSMNFSVPPPQTHPPRTHPNVMPSGPQHLLTTRPPPVMHNRPQGGPPPMSHPRPNVQHSGPPPRGYSNTQYEDSPRFSQPSGQNSRSPWPSSGPPMNMPPRQSPSGPPPRNQYFQ